MALSERVSYWSLRWKNLKTTACLNLSMSKAIKFRAIIEVLGKPKDYVESSLQDYLKKLKEDDSYQTKILEIAPAEQQKDPELWSTFAELEVGTDTMGNLINFCFDYMPSLIEILAPENLNVNETDLSNFLNDLQARLHNLDMLTKQTKMENDYLVRNMSIMLKNTLLVLLARSSYSSGQLSKMTGVDKDKLEDFLDSLIDEDKVNLKEGVYSLKMDSD